MPDLLQTLMEVSIAYVGFAAIFGVLSVRADGWPVEIRFMFRALIEVGLTAVLLCVYPLVVLAFEAHGPDQRLIATWLGLATGLSLTGWRAYLLRRHLVRLPREAPLLFGLSLISFIVMLGNAMLWQSPGPYILAVIITLVSTSAIFLAMIYRMFPITSQADQSG
jgi:hypothetical protein